MFEKKNVISKEGLGEDIFPILPTHIVAILCRISLIYLQNVTEIRLRVNQPLLLVLGNKDVMLNVHGEIVADPGRGYRCNRDDIMTTLQLISKNSLYAFEQEIKMGFLTILGGHRVGLVGQAVLEQGEVKVLKNISSLNIRIAREIKGCADQVLPYIRREGHILSTLIISPPCCGKTTLLRDLIRQISSGNPKNPGVQVGVVDERSEIAACKNGIATVDLGVRTDVMDACPKGEGMLMLIRSMAPRVVATDELGRAEDVYAIREALQTGVSVLTTVHGRNIKEVLARPHVGELIQENFFERYILLNNEPKVGTVEQIIAGKENKVLWKRGEVDC